MITSLVDEHLPIDGQFSRRLQEFGWRLCPVASINSLPLASSVVVLYIVVGGMFCRACAVREESRYVIGWRGRSAPFAGL